MRQVLLNLIAHFRKKKLVKTFRDLNHLKISEAPLILS